MYLGIDLGTSSVKCLLVSEAGEAVGAGSADYPLHTPNPGWAEQDPEDWWRATLSAARRALEGHEARALSAIGLSGQMHTLVLLDAEGEPVRPAIAWPDARTAREVEAFHARVPREAQVSILGNPPATGFTGPSLLWVKHHEPDVYQRARHALLPKDYLRYRLTGALATEASDASATLLFDVARRRWAAEIIGALELSPDMVPAVIASASVGGGVTRQAAAALGLREGIPVAAGAGDQAAAAMGCGLVDPGMMLVTMGSGGQVFAPLTTPTPDPELRVHCFCHAREDRWHLLGAVQNVGLALDWIRKLFGWSWERLLGEAESVAPGADGLLFLPYLTGERTPHMDPAARGTLWGLTLAHGPAHVARAALEGVTFALKDAVDACLDVGASAERLVVAGGGARNPFRRQLLADVVGRPLHLADVEDASAKGAAVLAGAPMPRLSPTLAAEPGTGSERYQDIALRYGDLYRTLRAGFER
jgi:xylulokinase